MPEFVELGFRPSLGIKREVLYRYLDERADSPRAGGRGLRLQR